MSYSDILKPRREVLSEDGIVLKGRIQPHPPGPAANKLYKDGGLSLMEMLIPWVVLSG